MSTVPRSEESFAKSNGLDLCYQTFGRADGEPLLLVMGLGAQMVLWDEDFCEKIAAQGFRVIRFDNRDIGRSTRLSGGGRVTLWQFLAARFFGKKIPAVYLLKDMAADAIGLLDALNITSAHVVGASMGGMIAQEMALAKPERLKTLTSIMSTSGARGLPGPTAEARAVLMMAPPKSKEDYLTMYRNTWKVLRDGSFPEDEAADTARAERNYARGLNPPGVARQFSAILASGSRKERLASLKIPTLVVHGARDPLVPLEHGLDVYRTVPGAKLLQIEDMGHAIAIRHQQIIAEAIIDLARGGKA